MACKRGIVILINHFKYRDNDMNWAYMTRLVGAMLIAVGALLVLLPGILKVIPSFEGAHLLIWWTFYKKGKLLIGTSPILIILGLVLILLRNFLT